MTKNSNVTLQITDMTPDGNGIGRTDGGMVVFVPGAVTGDSIRAKIIKAGKSFCVGRLEELLKGKTTAFVGQSGVGKSSLVNVLTGSSERVGEISLKYDRGRHTTNHCSYIQSDDYAIIDTPGVREIMVPFEEKEEVVRSFPEFAKAGCRYDGCLHQGQEGCAVPALVESGEIDGQRYLGYLRILESLDERRPVYMRKKLLEK